MSVLLTVNTVSHKQHGAVLIIFLLNLQTITITRMLSNGGAGGPFDRVQVKVICCTHFTAVCVIDTKLLAMENLTCAESDTSKYPLGEYL